MNFTDENNEELIKAALEENIEILRYAAECNYPLASVKNSDGFGLLHYAVMAKSIPMIELLLKGG